MADLTPAQSDVVAQLRSTGLFDQLQVLEQSLGALAGDLATLGTAAVERSRETESLAAHLLALESLIVALLRAHPVDREAVGPIIAERTHQLAPDGNGAATVQGIVDQILVRASVGTSPSKHG